MLPKKLVENILRTPWSYSRELQKMAVKDGIKILDEIAEEEKRKQKERMFHFTRKVRHNKQIQADQKKPESNLPDMTGADDNSIY